MISKKARFPLRENQDIFRNSSRVSGTYADVYISSIEQGIPQASVIVGKNVSLLAVVRNKTKRRVSHILSDTLLPLVKKTLIVRLKSRAATASYETLSQELTHLVAKK